MNPLSENQQIIYDWLTDQTKGVVPFERVALLVQLDQTNQLPIPVRAAFHQLSEVEAFELLLAYGAWGSPAPAEETPELENGPWPSDFVYHVKFIGKPVEIKTILARDRDEADVIIDDYVRHIHADYATFVEEVK